MPPSLGLLKLNFDTGKVGQNGIGWGFVVWDNTGEVVLAGIMQDEGFLSPEVEESRACLFTLKTAAAHDFKTLVVEGDSFALISKLKKGDMPNNLLGYFISNIISFC